MVETTTGKTTQESSKKIELNAVVTSIMELSPLQRIIRVSADGWEIPDFKAGQFVALGLHGSAPRCDIADLEDPPSDPDKLIRRAYSIASSSIQKQYLEFYISLMSSGTLTPRLFAMNIGDRLYLSPRVTGLFTFDDIPADQNIVLMATGTGVAPYMSMLRTHLTCGGPSRYAVLHGAYHSWDLGYRAELLTLQHMCDNLSYFATIDRPDEEPIPWSGPVGFVQELWEKGVIEENWGMKPTPKNTHVFLCGNPGMIQAALEILEAEGFKKHTRKEAGQIHIEEF